MPHLEILFHGGCPSELSVEALAREVRRELPDWQVLTRLAATEDADSLGVLALPAFLMNSRVVATGIPKLEWQIAQCREGERDRRS